MIVWRRERVVELSKNISFAPSGHALFPLPTRRLRVCYKTLVNFEEECADAGHAFIQGKHGLGGA